MPGTQPFHTFSGVDSQVAMMQRQESVTELRTPDYVVELLPYKGGRFSAVLLLPAGTLTPAQFSTLFTASLWTQALGFLHHSVGDSLGGKCRPWSQAQTARVECDASLQMPKFKLEYSKDLTETLHAMGMPVPGASMADICSACFISSVVQKTYLEVDEHGTTAAAATGVAVATALRLPTVVDRPFGFALIDNATDAPLFLGAIGQL
jgi:serine protease inhibitor